MAKRKKPLRKNTWVLTVSRGRSGSSRPSALWRLELDGETLKWGGGALGALLFLAVLSSPFVSRLGTLMHPGADAEILGSRMEGFPYFTWQSPPAEPSSALVGEGVDVIVPLQARDPADLVLPPSQ